MCPKTKNFGAETRREFSLSTFPSKLSCICLWFIFFYILASIKFRFPRLRISLKNMICTCGEVVVMGNEQMRRYFEHCHMRVGSRAYLLNSRCWRRGGRVQIDDFKWGKSIFIWIWFALIRVSNFIFALASRKFHVTQQMSFCDEKERDMSELWGFLLPKAR